MNSMIEDIINDTRFRRFFPPLAALGFIVLFVSLGLWQLDRAAQKNALFSAFEAESGYVRPSNFSGLETFQRIEVDGRFLDERQILVDNIVRDGRVGYFVVTPFRLSAGEPLLLVNRGWVAKSRQNDYDASMEIDDELVTIRGLAGNLPRVGLRPGDAFAGNDDWPRVALYPTLEEVSAALDEALQPVVLLLAPEAENGFRREWRPNVSGPQTHYSYAFQWFAMAVAVVVLFGWVRYRRQTDD